MNTSRTEGTRLKQAKKAQREWYRLKTARSPSRSGPRTTIRISQRFRLHLRVDITTTAARSDYSGHDLPTQSEPLSNSRCVQLSIRFGFPPQPPSRKMDNPHSARFERVPPKLGKGRWPLHYSRKSWCAFSFLGLIG